jgi:hypothetical protein
MHEVDYSRNAVTTISEQFFGGELIPPKDWNGTFLLIISRALLMLGFHIDSDMMFGGGSQIRIAEAKRLMEARPEVMVCNPHPGPPNCRWATALSDPYARTLHL